MEKCIRIIALTLAGFTFLVCLLASSFVKGPGRGWLLGLSLFALPVIGREFWNTFNKGAAEELPQEKATRPDEPYGEWTGADNKTFERLLAERRR
jgi:hypothetical protein